MSRRVSRRTVLGTTLLAGLATACGPGQTGELVRSGLPLPDRFRVPLPLPRTLDLTERGGIDLGEIVQQEVDVEILPGVRTRAMTYGGTFPGPLVVSRSERPLLLTHRNETGVPTVVHLHGGHTPSVSDGYPTDLVEPGQAREYAYPMTQRGATLWYHDHTMDLTGERVYRGLAGMHLVRDDEDDALPLPRGDHELPLLIVDRAFDEDGQFAYPSAHTPDTDTGHDTGHVIVDQAHVEGVLGDVMLVNGAPWPVHEVDAARYRLRILNGCNARHLELALDPPPPGGEAFLQVGSDGGLLVKPQPHDLLPVAQAERFDVIVDFSRWAVGSEVTLLNRAGSGSTTEVMRFVVARRGNDDSAPPERLPETLSEIEPLSLVGAPLRQWHFTRGNVHGQPGWTINDRVFDPNRMDATVPLGTVELWRFVADMHHPVHVHLDPFQVVGRDGQGPSPTDVGWKDTVSLAPGEVVDVAVRFTTYAGRYLLHCHNLEHEDRMMMAAFETV